MSEKWCYDLNLNSEIWQGSFCDSREEAISEAISEAAYDDIKSFKIGRCVEAFNFGINVDEVFYKWQEKYNYKPYFYTIVDEEIIEVKKQQCICWSKYGKSLNSGIKCSNCGREL